MLLQVDSFDLVVLPSSSSAGSLLLLQAEVSGKKIQWRFRI